jgi:hypothetical protein
VLPAAWFAYLFSEKPQSYDWGFSLSALPAR